MNRRDQIFLWRRLLAGLGVVVLLGAAVSPRAAIASAKHEELRFAAGLRGMGFLTLAADQLMRASQRRELPQWVRDEATIELAELYAVLGRGAAAQGDHRSKREYYEKATTQYTDYLQAVGETLGKQERSRLLSGRGILAQDLAEAALRNLQLTVDPEEMKTYRQQALKWFTMAEKDLVDSSSFLLKLQDALRKTAKTDDEKERFKDVQEISARALRHRGEVKFYFSELFDSKKEAARHKKLLAEAVACFERLAKEYSIFDIRYTAKRYLGLCHTRLGNYQKAIKQFEEALSAHPSEATVWILRRARLDMASAYLAWGKAERALITAEVLISDLRSSVEDGASPRELAMLQAARLERAKARVAWAGELMTKAAEYRKKGSKKMAARAQKKAVGNYRQAVQTASDIAEDPSTRWSRNAKALLDVWVAQSGKILPEPIKVKPSVHTYVARGWKLWQERKYSQCIEEFREAVKVADPKRHGATVLPECWYKMGQAYYNLSDTSHTGGLYNYYCEAMLCFTHAAEAYAMADPKIAAAASRMAKEFAGAIFEQRRKEGGDLTYEGDRYYRALQHFGERFPRHPDAPRAMYQSAELARTLERFRQASEVYASINEENSYYFEARHRAAFCLYMQALKQFEAAPEDSKKPVGDLLRLAGEQYREFMEWYADNEDLMGPRKREDANRWVSESKLSLGKMLVHDVWCFALDAKEGAQKALELLDGFEDAHLAGDARKGIRDRLLPEAFLVHIQAYRRLDQLAKAEAFVDAIITQYTKHQLSSRAAALLGYAYLQKRKELEGQRAESRRVKDAGKKAAHYLGKALELSPQESLAVYLAVGRELFLTGDYEQSVNILKGGLKRFPARRGRPDKMQLAAMATIEEAYLKTEDWKNLEFYARKLHRIEPRNIDYLMDLALAFEKTNRFPKAIEHWRKAKRGAGTAREAEFKATVHLARCYAKSKQPDHGFKIMAWMLVGSSRWLARPEWTTAVREVFDECFPSRYGDLADFVLQIVSEDLNVLRVPQSRKAVEALIHEKAPGKMPQLRELLRKAEAGL